MLLCWPQQPVEQHLVAVVQGVHGDITGEVIGLAPVLLVHARDLVLQGEVAGGISPVMPSSHMLTATITLMPIRISTCKMYASCTNSGSATRIAMETATPSR